jgi:RimJ/RimL family protein N-acetyltransferase
MEAARIILNDSFAHNPMFVPLTREEYFFQAREMMWVIDQRIAHVVFHGCEPVGVVVCIPDLNPQLCKLRSQLSWSTPIHYWRHWRQRRRAVIIYYAIIQEYQGRGIMGALLTKTIQQLKAVGYTNMGITWIADINGPSLRQMEKIGARQLHRTHLFRKNLTKP